MLYSFSAQTPCIITPSKNWLQDWAGRGPDLGGAAPAIFKRLITNVLAKPLQTALVPRAAVVFVPAATLRQQGSRWAHRQDRAQNNTISQPVWNRNRSWHWHAKQAALKEGKSKKTIQEESTIWNASTSLQERRRERWMQEKREIRNRQ